MEKKIKSVKLKNDYRTNDWVIQKETVGSYNLLSKIYYFESDYGIRGFFIKDILDNKTDLFEIEYEPETKFIDVRIEYNPSDPLTVEDIEFSLKKDYAKGFIEKVTELSK